MQAIQAIANFLRLQDRHRLIENARFQVQEQRHRDRLEIADSIGRLHRRAREYTRAPGLLPQFVGEHRRKFFQLFDIRRGTNQRESELPGLLKLAIVNFQACDRTKTRGQNVEHIRIKPQLGDEDCDAAEREHGNAGPNERTPLRNNLRDEITNPHIRWQKRNADSRVSNLAGQKRNRKVSLPAMYRTDCRSCAPMSFSRTPSQPRNCCGARSIGPDQPLPASGPLTSAKDGSWRIIRSVTFGPFENVSSKSPVCENRTSTSPISVIFGARYESCPLRTCQSGVGSAN